MDEYSKNAESLKTESRMIKNKYIEIFREKYNRIPCIDEITEYLELRNISSVA